MSNNSESVERIVGSNPGSTATPEDAKRSDAVNSGKMPVRNAGQPSGRPEKVPDDAQNSDADADRGEPSRQTSEAGDEAGQV